MSNATANETATSERPPIYSFHHPAIKCFDAEETRRFYEDILGLPLNASVAINDDGLGGDFYFMHVFFRMGDGDFLAFFDKDIDIKPDIFESFSENDFRLTLRVGTEAELEQIQSRLSAAGVTFTGPVENAWGKSLFCDDPNKLHLEITLPAPDQEARLAREKTRAKDVLAEWTRKTAARKEQFKKAREAAFAEAAAAAPG